MEYILITLGMVALIVAVLVLLARAYPGSGSDLVGWRPTRDPATEVERELDDVRQMIEAQNEYRRKRGAPELTELDAERMAHEDDRVRRRARPLDSESLGELDRELRDPDEPDND